mmetsp:Transcript_14570/g.58183  ORF Transcript_14570/g.58183 Transcript_14570/m.58183 type:complete len:356 (+) Transcript_14570:580-1647(+)
MRYEATAASPAQCNGASPVALRALGGVVAGKSAAHARSAPRLSTSPAYARVHHRVAANEAGREGASSSVSGPPVSSSRSSWRISWPFSWRNGEPSAASSSSRRTDARSRAAARCSSSDDPELAASSNPSRAANGDANGVSAVVVVSRMDSRRGDDNVANPRARCCVLRASTAERRASMKRCRRSRRLRAVGRVSPSSSSRVAPSSSSFSWSGARGVGGGARPREAASSSGRASSSASSHGASRCAGASSSSKELSERGGSLTLRIASSWSLTSGRALLVLVRASSSSLPFCASNEASRCASTTSRSRSSTARCGSPTSRADSRTARRYASASVGTASVAAMASSSASSSDHASDS